MTERRPTTSTRSHAYRTPDTLTAEERALAHERAKTLYPGQRLSQSGAPEDEHHLRVAIAEAEILDNPSLRPHTPDNGLYGDAEAAAELAVAEARGEAVEAGPGFVGQVEDPLALDLAELVAAYRRQHGLSQRELAERLGMKQPHVARLEAGLHTPSVDTLVRVARALDASLRVDVTPDGAHLAPAEPAA